MFCRGWQSNVQKFITQLHSYRFAHKPFVQSDVLVKYYFPAGYVVVQMSPILICLFVIPSSTEGPKARLRVSGYN